MSLNKGITFEQLENYLLKHMDEYIQDLINETQNKGMEIPSKEGQMIKPQLGEVNGR